ncbi:MAG: alanine--tRNA ligase [Eubacteriaceae bacterium]|nr:alanine--tRNA ligase [Eubacteriaceae bacterium]
MLANELRQLYIDFFKEHGHAEISSASLIPENDPSVLFTTAGMHPLVPYLLGEKHPAGNRLVDCQKCIRTGDIDEVGDASHLTFFEMMGNWSLNDYFKDESIRMSHEFLTKVLQIPQDKISVSVFAGDEDVPRDETTYNVWKSLGYPDERIHFYGRKDNWWGPAGETGPCGPDTEIFYDTGKPACGPACGPSCGCGKYVEIWNNVFMEYNKNKEGVYEKMPIHNVDTGLGLDRVLYIMNGQKSVYDTEQFMPIIRKLEELTGVKYDGADDETVFAFRVIADHMRAATFILGDDKAVSPSNVDQGYVLRRIIRRTMRYLRKLGGGDGIMNELAKVVVEIYGPVYAELRRNENFIQDQLAKEEMTFNRTLDQGMKEASKILSKLSAGDTIDGLTAFHLYDTFGFPLEFTQEVAAEAGVGVDVEGFREHFKEHQEKSRAGAEKKFKGGLSDASEETARLHTATHLLDGALRKVLGDTVWQRGSNITPERLRFDFSFDRKMTKEELDEVSRLVNEAIAADVPVTCEEMTVEEAKAQGAIGVFTDKYGEKVKVYTMGPYSKEICGGPHAKHTGELVNFKILKEEASSAGVRRIKAVVDYENK